MLIVRQEFRDLIPPLAEHERSELERSIREEGCRDPILVWDSDDGPVIVDGHNRYDICAEHEIDYETRAVTSITDENSAKAWMIRNQFARRNLTPYQRAELALELETLISPGQGARTDLADSQDDDQWEKVEELSTDDGDVTDERAANSAQVTPDGADQLQQNSAQVESRTSDDKGRQRSPDGSSSKQTRDKLATIAGVSHDTISRAKLIRDNADEETLKKLRAGETTINREHNRLRNAKRGAEKLDKGRSEPLPDGKYRTVVVCPNWKMPDIDGVTARKPYVDGPTMTVSEVANLPISVMLHEAAHVYLWTPQEHLPKAFSTLNRWRLRSICAMTWHRPDGPQPEGLPQFNAEFIVFGRQGSLPFDDTKRFAACFAAPVSTDSILPDEFYTLVERVSPGPYLDVFGRKPRDSWRTFPLGTETEEPSELLKSA